MGLTTQKLRTAVLLPVLCMLCLGVTSCGEVSSHSEAPMRAESVQKQEAAATPTAGVDSSLATEKVGLRSSDLPMMPVLALGGFSPPTPVRPTVQPFDTAVRLDRSSSVTGTVSRSGVPIGRFALKGVQANIPASVSPMFLTWDAKIVVCAKLGDAPNEAAIQSMASGLIEPNDECYGWLMGLETSSGKPVWMLPYVKREDDSRLAGQWQQMDCLAVSPDHRKFAIRNPDFSVSVHDSNSGESLVHSPVFDETTNHLSPLMAIALPGHFSGDSNRFLRIDLEKSGNHVVREYALDRRALSKTIILDSGGQIYPRWLLTAADSEGSVVAILQPTTSIPPPRGHFLLRVWRVGQERPLLSVGILLDELTNETRGAVLPPNRYFSSLQFVERHSPSGKEDTPQLSLTGEIALRTNYDGVLRLGQHWSFQMEDAMNPDTLRFVTDTNSESVLRTTQSVLPAALRHVAIRSAAYAANLFCIRDHSTVQANDETGQAEGAFKAVDFAGRRLLHWNFSNPSLHSSFHRIPLTRGFWMDQWMPHLIVGDGSRRAVLDLAKGLRTVWTIESKLKDEVEPTPSKIKYQPGNLDIVDIKNAKFVASLGYNGSLDQHWSLHAVASCPEGKYLLTQLVVVPVPTGTTQTSPMEQSKFYKDMSDGKTVAYTLWELP